MTTADGGLALARPPVRERTPSVVSRKTCGVRPEALATGSIVALERACEKCVRDLLYCEAHDAYFCPGCDQWLEKRCGDLDCSFCPERPEQPSRCLHSTELHLSIDA